MKCIDAGFPEDCEGKTEDRPSLSGTGMPIPRCDKHWEKRLDLQEDLNRRYPAQQPSDFDPTYAGESWYEDEG